MDRIIDLFCQTSPLSDSTIAQLVSIIDHIDYAKMEEISKADTLCAFEYIVLEGVCRSYVVDLEGNEATLSFFVAGDVLPPQQVRTVNGKSLYHVQALTTASVLRFRNDEFNSLMQNNTQIQQWGTSVYNTELKHKVEKELEQITLPAMDRLLKFRQRYPSLENLIPHAYIASYLGISPVSLSRLRAKK